MLTLSQDGWTPLHAACQEGHAQIAKLLLQARASVELEAKVRWGVGQDCVCYTVQCTYTTSPPTPTPVHYLESKRGVDCLCNFSLVYAPGSMWGWHTEPCTSFVHRPCCLQYELMQFVSHHHRQCKSSQNLSWVYIALSSMWGGHTEPLALFTKYYVSRFCHLQYKLMQFVSCHHGQYKSSSVSINSQHW